MPGINHIFHLLPKTGTFFSPFLKWQKQKNKQTKQNRSEVDIYYHVVTLQPDRWGFFSVVLLYPSYQAPILSAWGFSLWFLSNCRPFWLNDNRRQASEKKHTRGRGSDFAAAQTTQWWRCRGSDSFIRAGRSTTGFLRLFSADVFLTSLPLQRQNKNAFIASLHGCWAKA